MRTSSPLPNAARELASYLVAEGFTADSIAAHLGPDATAALYRGEPGVVKHSLRDDSTLSRLIAFFILREPTPVSQLADVPHLEHFSLIDDSLARPAFDIRPHVIAGQEHLVISDLDASMTDIVPGPDHVLGVGAASLSLLSATPLSPARRVLDLGTGSGVQALAQARVAESVIATDVHPRAIELAEATMAANGVTNVELRQGSWFEPVAGETFDRIVANPPFVVGLPDVGHVYRDSGLNLDDASALV